VTMSLSAVMTTEMVPVPFGFTASVMSESTRHDDRTRTAAIDAAIRVIILRVTRQQQACHQRVVVRLAQRCLQQRGMSYDAFRRCLGRLQYQQR